MQKLKRCGNFNSGLIRKFQLQGAGIRKAFPVGDDKMNIHKWDERNKDFLKGILKKIMQVCLAGNDDWEKNDKQN